MKKQLFSTEVWVFITVLVIAIIIAIVYVALAVERMTDLQKFSNLNQFPTIQMENLPPPSFTFKHEGKSCSEQIIPCSNDNDCDTHCQSPDFQCTPVSEGDNMIVNGIKVGEGKWCLPKNTLNGCGKYTGQVVWSGEPGGSQGWKCICKYPSLFDGEYCLNDRSCKDKNALASGIAQYDNKLTNSKGQVYDPNLPNFYPPESEPNPYASDKDGNPVYTCRCGVGSDNKHFVSLPNDPQGCDLDPCTPSHSSPLWSEENQTCICGIDGVVKKDGTCVKVVCPYGSWNPLSQECDCLGRLGKMRCNARNREPAWQDNVPMCEDDENISGFQCVDRCIYKYCESENPSECGGGNGYRPEFFDKEAVVCIGGNCLFSGDNDENVCCECPQGTTYNTDTSVADYGVCIGQGRPGGDGCYHEKNFLVRGGPGNWEVRNLFDQDKIAKANAKCSIRCLDKQEGAIINSDSMKQMLDSLPEERVRNFIYNYCDVAAPFGFECGFMCDGDPNPPDNPPEQC